MAPAVVSVTRFGGATGAYNVVPTTVSIGGTMRALTLDVAKVLKSRLVEVCAWLWLLLLQLILQHGKGRVVLQ